MHVLINFWLLLWYYTSIFKTNKRKLLSNLLPALCINTFLDKKHPCKGGNYVTGKKPGKPDEKFQGKVFGKKSGIEVVMKLVKYDKTTPNKECAKVKPTKKTLNKKKSKSTKKEKKQKQQQRMSKKHGK